jgi:hypothetical protein
VVLFGSRPDAARVRRALPARSRSPADVRALRGGEPGRQDAPRPEKRRREGKSALLFVQFQLAAAVRGAATAAGRGRPVPASLPGKGGPAEVPGESRRDRRLSVTRPRDGDRPPVRPLRRRRPVHLRRQPLVRPLARRQGSGSAGHVPRRCGDPRPRNRLASIKLRSGEHLSAAHLSAAPLCSLREHQRVSAGVLAFRAVEQGSSEVSRRAGAGRGGPLRGRRRLRPGQLMGEWGVFAVSLAVREATPSATRATA